MIVDCLYFIRKLLASLPRLTLAVGACWRHVVDLATWHSGLNKDTSQFQEACMMQTHDIEMLCR